MAFLSTFIDNFPGNLLATDKWTFFTAVPTISGNTMQMTQPASNTNYRGIDSLSTYDLTGSYAHVELRDAGNQSLASLEVAILVLVLDGNNTTQWYLNSNNIQILKKVAGVQTQVGTTIAYNSAVHKYFRIRESGGTVFYDYSTDGKNWTNHASTSSLFAVTTLQVELSIGTYASEGSSTTVIWANLNTTNPSIAWFQG